MAATFSWAQTTGPYPGVRDAALGGYGELFAFSSDDSFGTHKPMIARGAFSYELWLQMAFTGDFDTVHDLWLWLALGPQQLTPWDGATLRMGCATEYRAPISTASDVATTVVPTNDRGPRNVTVGGSLDGVVSAPSGLSDYIVLQLQINANASIGFLTLQNLMATYLEGSATYIP